MKKKLNKPYIIAETACSHDGSISRLKKMIKAAYQAGSDAIQFQVWSSKNMVTKDNPNKLKMKKIEINYSDWKKIFNFTKLKYPKMEIIACIYDVEALKLTNKYGANAFKIHSSDLGNKNLLKHCSKLKKRIDLSIGGSTLKEISIATNILKKNNVWLMYGVQSFPTNPKKINLNRIKLYEKKYKTICGYQDHSPPGLPGVLIPSAAVAKGIFIIEKHITDTRNRNGTDLESALNPKEFKIFVNSIKETYLSLGESRFKKLNKIELNYRLYCKKKIYMKHDLNKNSILDENDFIIRQPINSKGISVDELDKIKGKKLIKNKKREELLEVSDLK